LLCVVPHTEKRDRSLNQSCIFIALNGGRTMIKIALVALLYVVFVGLASGQKVDQATRSIADEITLNR